MRVVVLDGARHRKWSGYGSLCRSAIRGLLLAGAEVVLPEYPQAGWELEEDEREEFRRLQRPSAVSSADIALSIGTPSAAVPSLNIPSVMYTQNALADLPTDWQQLLAGHAALIVPGEFDREVFARYYPRVFVVPQIVEAHRYRPVPSYRADVGPEPTFTYVGSYGYRKGTDVLLSAFAEAFPREPVRLRMFLGASPNLNLGDLISRARKLAPEVLLDVIAKPVSPSWMSRHYNQSDLIVTMSRGEGWCMPLHESLLSGTPVVAPDSTAMGAFLPEFGVLRVATDPLSLASVPDQGFRQRYETPLNAVYEPRYGSAVEALQRGVEELPALRDAALANVPAHRRLNDPGIFGAGILSALSQTLNEE